MSFVVVAKAKGFTLRLDPALDNGSGLSLVSDVVCPLGYLLHGH
jgi:hypothetical protein